MKALVTGSGGLLGHALLRVLGRRGVRVEALERRELDVARRSAVRRAVGRASPDVVFHCAAYTAVDRAESEPERAFAVNEGGAANVAAAVAATGALMVYPSTDYVFAGDSPVPRRPDDDVAPRSVYGQSKLAGEEAVRRSGARHLIARTSWLFGAGGRNFVDAVLVRAAAGERVRVVDDQTGRPTWTDELARALTELARAGREGVHHVACSGRATWRELAQEALRLAGVVATVEAVTTEEFGAAAPRPRWSVLDISATEAALGRPMPRWKDALAGYLAGEARAGRPGSSSRSRRGPRLGEARAGRPGGRR